MGSGEKFLFGAIAGLEGERVIMDGDFGGIYLALMVAFAEWNTALMGGAAPHAVVLSAFIVAGVMDGRKGVRMLVYIAGLAPKGCDAAQIGVLGGGVLRPRFGLDARPLGIHWCLALQRLGSIQWEDPGLPHAAPG